MFSYVSILVEKYKSRHSYNLLLFTQSEISVYKPTAGVQDELCG